MATNLISACMLLCLIFIAGCTKPAENQVALAIVGEREIAAPILDGFERAQPKIHLHRRFSDTLLLPSNDAGSPLEPEHNSANRSMQTDLAASDCVWDSEFLTLLQWHAAGKLQSRVWKLPRQWPKSFKAKDGAWVGLAATAQVILLNKDLRPETSDWPESIMELASPKWEGRCGVDKAIESRWRLHMAVLKSHASQIQLPSGGLHEAWRSDRSALDFPTWLAEYEARMAGNLEKDLNADAVARGELDWCVTSSSEATRVKELGANVELIFPDQYSGGFGTVFIPEGVAVFQGAKNPGAASVLADYLTSKSVESRLVMGDNARFPLWPDADERSRVSLQSPVRWADVDFEAAAKALSE